MWEPITRWHRHILYSLLESTQGSRVILLILVLNMGFRDLNRNYPVLSSYRVIHHWSWFGTSKHALKKWFPGKCSSDFKLKLNTQFFFYQITWHAIQSLNTEVSVSVVFWFQRLISQQSTLLCWFFILLTSDCCGRHICHLMKKQTNKNY